MPPSSSSHHSSSHHKHSSSSSSKSRPVSKSINATSQLSASALLAASAQASDELERILRGDRAAKHRSRSRSRTKSPHKAALAEAAGDAEDPFLVHTVGSSSSSVYNRERKQKEKHDPIASLLGTTSGLSISSSSSKKHHSSNSRHRNSRSHSNKHAHRSKSRSLSRTREAERLAASAALPYSHSHHSHHSHHSSSSHHHRHHHSSHPHEHGSREREREREREHERERSRTRSRSHSRNRYPDGLAPPLQSVGGGVDAELRGRFHDRFEHDYYEERGSPPMSPGRLHERATYEREMLLREEEEAYYRSRGMPYEPYADGVRRYAEFPRRDYAFDGTGRYAPQDPPEENPFDLEADGPKFEPAEIGDGKPSAGTVLTCGLCHQRYEDLSSANAGKVPRYLLCGHTWCTSCLQSELEKQQNLNLANDSGLPAASTTITSLSQPLGVTINLPCPLGTCAPTPVHEHGVLDLPVNKSFLDASRFLRSRRAAGHGLKDTGIGRGDERGEAERLAELNKELEEDAKVQQNITGSMALGTSLPCQQCSVHIASLYCQACNIRFCPSCSASVHIGRALAEHVKRGLVLPINVARARGLLFQANGGSAAPGAMNTVAAGLLCPTHADQPLSLYCRTCQIPVCRDCVTPLFKGQHLPPGHDVDLLTTVLASAHTELKHGVSAVEGTITKLEKYIGKAADQISVVSHRAQEVRTELHESFNLIRQAVLKSLAEREAALEKELLIKCKQKESRVHAHRAELAKLLTVARGAHEEGVRVLGSAEDDKTDIFAIRALLDVRAAINAGANAPSLLLDAPTLNQHDVLLRMRPRELIRLVESQISKAGGVIAAIPAEPSWVAFASSGTSLVLSWAPAAPPVEGEVLEYTLEVCELPRGWRSKLRVLQPSLFPNPSSPDEDSEEEMKWDGVGPLGDRSRAAVNWLSVPPGNVPVGGAEQIWKVAGGAGWAGPFTTLYSGEVTSVKHDNLNLLSAYIYRLSVKNDLGVSQQIYSLPSTLPCMHLNYASDMDSNGLITYLGSNGGTTPWTNPTVNNLLDISASSIQLGETTALTSRQASTFQTLDRHLSWIRIDVARGQPFRMLLSHYTLANCGRGVGVRRVLRNWALQGSLNGVDWVTLREHVKDQTLAPIPLATASWSVNQPTPQPYRYIRILQTDVNQAGDHHLALGQIELYGWLVRD